MDLKQALNNIYEHMMYNDIVTEEVYDWIKINYPESIYSGEMFRYLAWNKVIDTDLLEFLDYTDAETCKASIDKLSTAWNKAIEKAVNDRIKTNTVPKMANNNNTITKEQFNKMNYQQKLELYNKNKDLYDKLSK